MAADQGIVYVPQWANMTLSDIVFQTNNVVGNFNYPKEVLAYKEIIKFLYNCPLKTTITKCPSVIYKNLLGEFWSTVVAFDLNPPSDESE